MRFLSGLILGCLLTIGVAWFHDSGVDAGASDRRMVNWEVVDSNVRQLTASLREEWDRLVSRRT